MKTPIAIHNLWHQGAKTAVSIGGVAFALLLVFMQLGFMGAVSHTATNVLEKLKFDILIRGQDYVHLYEPGQIDRKWLRVAESTEGVAAAHPFWITIQNWRKMPNQRESEQSDFQSKYLPIAVMAIEPQEQVFDLEQVQALSHHLTRDGSMLIDDQTQADYGPWNGKKFSESDLLQRRCTEIGGNLFCIDGLYQLGTGLAANGAVIMGHASFESISPWDVRTSTSLGLVQVHDRSPESVARVLERLVQRARSAEMLVVEETSRKSGLSSIRSILGAGATAGQPGAVEILTRDQAMARETYRWLWQTPIGLIFQLGVVLSLIVGAAIVYMVLSTDVANRLPEYATLLAMGYSRKYLASIVMTQAIVLCCLGFLCAWGIAELLYRATTAFSGIPLAMNPHRVALVSILGLLMCCVSGLLALRKLWKAEPANLF